MSKQQPRYLRLGQIIGRRSWGNSPATDPLIPVSKTTWWDGVRSGRFPKPNRRLGGRVVLWNADEIFALLEKDKEHGE